MPIKRIRKICGLTQKELAQACGVSMGTLCNFESGFPVGRESIIKILETLKRLVEQNEKEEKTLLTKTPKRSSYGG